jgi:ProP effector
VDVTESKVAETRRILSDRFPKCFMGKGKWKRPLAIGIHLMVFKAAPDLSKTQVRKAIADYVMGPMYQRNLKAGAIRIDINGDAIGEVSGEQERRARRLIQRKGWNRRRKPTLPSFRKAA